MKNLLNILLAVSLVVILIGGMVIMANHAYAGPLPCCHCVCDCGNPTGNPCRVPYLSDNCPYVGCGNVESYCGYGPGGWCTE